MDRVSSICGVLAPAVVGLVLAAPPPAQAATAYLAIFSGTYASQCSLPHDRDDGTPTSGPYSCTHAAESTLCQTAVDGDVASTQVRDCRVLLTYGYTEGAATGGRAPFSSVDSWVCVNGRGDGQAAYGPPGAALVGIPVRLTVDGEAIDVEGEAAQTDTHRAFVLRGSIPNACARDAGGSGFQGTVSAS